jgi:antitoxin HicB
MRNFTYPAILTPDLGGSGFTVTFRDLPEAITQGENTPDALAQGADCLEEAIAARIRLSESIPLPSRLRKEEYPISMPVLMAAKAALFLAVKESAVTNSELARRLNLDEKEVRRLLDPRHKSKINRIEAALEALGQRLFVGIRAA